MAIVDLAVSGIVAVFFGFIVWANIYHKRTLREPPRASAGALHERREDERSSA